MFLHIDIAVTLLQLHFKLRNVFLFFNKKFQNFACALFKLCCALPTKPGHLSSLESLSWCPLKAIVRFIEKLIQ